MDGIQIDDIVRAYDRYAPWYDRLFGTVLEQGRVQLAAEVGREPVSRLLEVGVGTGLTLGKYPSDTQVVGIDISDAMLRRALIKAESRHPACASLALMDAEALAFADGTFDAIAVPYVLSVTPDPERMKAELARVCKPKGRILILNHFSNAGVWTGLEHAVSRYTARIGFRSRMPWRVLDFPGWQIESVKRVNWFGLSRLVVIRNGAP